MRDKLRRAWSSLAALAAASAVLGCAAPGAQRIVGPDGTAMAHVHCGSDQGTCFRLAGELCPLGYDLEPALARYDGNFLVRCRATPHPVTRAAVTCEGPARYVAAKAQGTWPPANEPWSSAYPWAHPEASAKVQPPTTSSSPAAPVEIDLGY